MAIQGAFLFVCVICGVINASILQSVWKDPKKPWGLVILSGGLILASFIGIASEVFKYFIRVL